VLAEALAVGLPVVSTDRPSGPAEILKNGRYGKLTPVNDVDALAKAILATLKQPLSRAELQAAAVRFRVDVCADQYLQVMGLAGAEV
jgi:glycosyltransferase involved in cell wall biosynthesis